MSDIKVGDKGWSEDWQLVTVRELTGNEVWYIKQVEGGSEKVWCSKTAWLSRLRQRPITDKPEYTGGSVDYYKVEVKNPTSFGINTPYLAECNDIIEALGMNYAEGNAFKALWRRAAHRTLGKKKAGAKDDGLYDAEKVAFFGQRLVEQSKAAK